MKRVDHMIKYLSGDLSAEDSSLFEKELSEDELLNEDFKQVSFAYELMGDQLRKKDEEAFISALQLAMNKSSLAGNDRKPGVNRWGYLLLAMAASAAILVSILWISRDSELNYTAWYHPFDDPLIGIIQEETRGSSTQELAGLWEKGNYNQCRRMAEARLSSHPDDQYTLLFYLLSSMETGELIPVLEILENTAIEPGTPLGSALTWYHALALIKTGQTEQASALLSSLEKLPGPYRGDAHKLEKMLTK